MFTLSHTDPSRIGQRHRHRIKRSWNGCAAARRPARTAPGETQLSDLIGTSARLGRSATCRVPQCPVWTMFRCNGDSSVRHHECCSRSAVGHHHHHDGDRASHGAHRDGSWRARLLGRRGAPGEVYLGVPARSSCSRVAIRRPREVLDGLSLRPYSVGDGVFRVGMTRRPECSALPGRRRAQREGMGGALPPLAPLPPDGVVGV